MILSPLVVKISYETIKTDSCLKKKDHSLIFM